MARKSSIAILLEAMGRMSPCAITRFMWSSASAFSHTEVQCVSNSLNVDGSDTSPPGVAMMASG